MWLPPEANKIFIAGTDTDIGKTHVATELLMALAKQGCATVAMKPLASGCAMTAQGLRNQDALCLQKAATIKLPYEQINPLAFAEAIAPHIAAEKINRPITLTNLITLCQPALNHAADVHIIEGVGGWHAPLNAQETMADFVAALDMPVLLVVGMRLGCLSHALLTYEAIINRDVKCLGWVANCVHADMPALDENIAYLHKRLPVPLLATIPYGQTAAKL